MRRLCLGTRALGVAACATLVALVTSVASSPALAQQPTHAHPSHPRGGHGAPRATTTTAPRHAQPAPTASTGARESTAARRGVAGGSTQDDVALGAESPELKALRDAERELFPPAMPSGNGASWPSELPSPMPTTDAHPRVHASGLPPSPVRTAPPAREGTKDLAWLAQLQMPELPVRWDPRVVRYLELFKDDARGRATFAHFYRRAGRYKDVIKKTLRRKGLPEDLLWVAMVESGFDPSIRSPVGAAGLWQFMPDAGKQYGLQQDRWVDQRLAPVAATEAAADFLSDLHRRFGSWELALASYNMGYGGMASVVRRYNTNDFWALSHAEGSLPWETTLYVPKIVAIAVVAKNLSAFGFGDLSADAPVEYDEVHVPPGTALATVAQAAGCGARDVELLNPELRASRTPPDGDAAGYAVKVPAGRGAAVTLGLPRLRQNQPSLERYVVRFGETLEQIAAARHVPVARIVELNGIAAGEAVRGGSVLLLPPSSAASATTPTTPATKPVVIVPQETFSYPDRRRVFYRVLVGDTLKEIAAALNVTVDEVRRWNNIDPVARLVEGMTLQAFVSKTQDLSRVVVLNESDVRPIAVGTDEFFAHLEAQKGHRRITVTAHAGETIESIGKRYQVPARTMERINRRGRAEALREGETVVVYVPASNGASAVTAGTTTQAPVTAQNEGRPSGPVPPPPVPDLLPAPR